MLCTFRISDAYFVSKNLNFVFLSQVKSVIFPMCLAVLNNVGFDLWLAVGNTSHKLFGGIFSPKMIWCILNNELMRGAAHFEERG